MSTTRDEAFSKAIGYAWGAEDYSGTRTASPTGAPGTLTFAEHYAARQEAFNTEATYWMPAIQDAYRDWQAARGYPDWTR